VGYYEYTHALAKFDELVKTATPEEMEVVDTIIGKRDELSIPTNLSVNIPHPANVLDEVADDPQDKFVRQGLNWMMGLARMEVASVTAGFMDQKDPYRFIGATEFELDAYREILVDGLRTHYWALQNDADLPLVRKGKASIQRLTAYGRRLFLTLEMLRTAQALSHGATPEQLRELSRWEDHLSQIQSNIIFEISEYIRRAPPTELIELPCPSVTKLVQSQLTPQRPAGPQAPPANSASQGQGTAIRIPPKRGR
jgi:hypothetical protein